MGHYFLDTQYVKISHCYYIKWDTISWTNWVIWRQNCSLSCQMNCRHHGRKYIKIATKKNPIISVLPPNGLNKSSKSAKSSFFGGKYCHLATLTSCQLCSVDRCNKLSLSFYPFLQKFSHLCPRSREPISYSKILY